jgi:hypothetical protein
MKFQIVSRTSAIPNNKLIYRADEFSFDIEPTPIGGFTSILVNDLNLEVDDAGRVISLWGLCPYTQWKRSSLISPVADVGKAAYVTSQVPLKRGVSMRINPRQRWSIFADPGSGWVCVRSGNTPDFATEIFSGIILETSEGGDLCSIWLRPEHFPEVFVA